MPSTSERLEEVLAAYLEAAEAGHAPSRAALLAAHPDLAGELAEFLDNCQQLRPLAAALVPAAPPRRIGDYELLEEVARGGMGVVYKARQTGLNRLVALKTVLPGQLDGESRARFRAEAEAVARLEHPNIVPIYEVGEQAGLTYFSMRYVAGGSLAQRGGEMRGDARRIVRLVARTAAAVQHAHDRGVLHRDIKPANIILDERGQPHVTDFGLAKVFRSRTQITQSLGVVGTASYMAPEQAYPDRMPLTVAADVYSLGAVLYFLLTGRAPFVGATPFDTLLQAVQQPPVRPRKLDRRINRDLEAICLKCLEKDPAARYPSARALAQELETWHRGEPVGARPPGAMRRFGRGVRRHWPTVAALCVLFAGLGALAAGASLAAVRSDRDRGSAERQVSSEQALRLEVEKARDEAQAALERERALRDTNRSLLARQYVRLGLERLDAGDAPAGLLWFAESLALEGGNVANRVRIAAALRDCPRLAQVWYPPGEVKRSAFSADGRRAALALADGSLVLGAVGGELVSLHKGETLALAFNPDGILAAGFADGTVRIWDAKGKPMKPWPTHKSEVRAVAFGKTAGSLRLAVAYADGTARLFDGTGKALGKPLSHPDDVFAARMSPDGRWLATASGKAKAASCKVRLWPLTGTAPTPTRTLDVPLRKPSLAFSGDSKRLLALANRNAYLFDVTSGERVGRLRHVRGSAEDVLSHDGLTALVVDGQRVETQSVNGERKGPLLTPKGGDAIQASFSGDRQRVVTVSAERSARVWDAASGAPVSPPLRHGRVTSASLDASGQRLLTLTDEPAVRVYDVAPRQRAEALAVPASAKVRAMSPDGRTVLLRREDGGAQVWDTSANKQIAAIKPGAWAMACFSPDGKLVATAGDSARAWSVATGEPAGGAVALTDVVEVRFSPDGGRMLVVGRKGEAIVQDLRKGGEAVRTKLGGEVRPDRRAVSDDGRLVAVVQNRREVKVREAGGNGGKVISLLAPPSLLRFSPDVRRLLTATADGSVSVWSVEGKPVAPSVAFGSPVKAAAFGPRLLACATEGRVRVWEAETGLAVVPELLTEDTPVELLFSADGRALLMRGTKTVARLPLPADERPAEDLARLARVLSGQRTHPESGGLVPLSPAEARALWPELRQRFPREFAME